MTFLVKDGSFGYASGNAFMPITPVSRYEYATKRYLYRFVCDADDLPFRRETKNHAGRGICLIGLVRACLNVERHCRIGVCHRR